MTVNVAVTKQPDPVGELPDGTPFFARIGELVYDAENGGQCHLCGRWLQFVGGSHLRVTHGWTLAAYRDAFQLATGAQTCSRELSGRLSGIAQAKQGHQGFGTPPSHPVDPARRLRWWRSLAVNRPALAAELHPSRNGGLDPSAVGVASARKVWARRLLPPRVAGNGC